MTDKEIIKALECCYRKDTPCRDCPFNEFEDCNDVLMADYVFNLIKRQQAEIERLKEDNFIKSQKRANIFEIVDAYERGKSEAIKEFCNKRGIEYVENNV